MRIAYFTSIYPRATDTFIQREVTGLRARGLDVRTFSVRRTGTDHDVGAEILEHKRNTFYALPVGPGKLIGSNLALLLHSPARYLGALAAAAKTARPGLRGLLYQLAYFQEAVILAAEFQRQGVEHIHNHFGDVSGNVTLLASLLTGIPYSITVHGPHIFFDPTHWALAEKVRHSAFIVCISYYCRSQMMLFTAQAEWHRLRIVRCGVDVGSFSCAPVRQTSRKLLYTGRLALEKGLPILFEALKILQDDGYDFELTLIGDGADRAQLEALARELDIADRLNFAGYQDQEGVRLQLQQSDVFVLPSFAEGVPVSLMEAMASGLPVVGTYVGGVAELIDSGQSGLLVPPSDSLALSEAIASYLNDYELRRRVSQLGRAVIVNHYNLQTELDKLAGLFLGKHANPS